MSEETEVRNQQGPMRVRGIECGQGREALLEEAGASLIGYLFGGQGDALERVREIDGALSRRAQLRVVEG